MMRLETCQLQVSPDRHTANGDGDGELSPELFEKEATGINILRQFPSVRQQSQRLQKVEEGSALHA
jgi:hypothetical protein